MNTPPPPPPPPALFVEIKKSSIISAMPRKVFMHFTNDDFKRLLNVSPDVVPVAQCFNSVRPEYQNGPTCGLAALSIATSSTPQFVPEEVLLQEACKLNFSKQGEMFSAQNLRDLAQLTTSFDALLVDNDISSHVSCILQTIAAGGFVLVPYDADFNCRPCVRYGHKAHWAVLCGFVVSKTSKQVPVEYSPCQCRLTITTKDTIYKNKKTNYNYLKVGNCDKSLDINDFSIKNFENVTNNERCEIFVAALQGKSSFLMLWSLEELIESNNNLIEVNPLRDLHGYLIPEGGIEKGLRGKAVLLVPT